MNGIPRGKRVRRSDLAAVAKNGLMMPSSVFIMDPLGNCVEETGRLWETGDHDHQCHLLAGTLVPIPIDGGKRAQVVMTIDVKDELDPRAVLVDQVEKLARDGRHAVAAVELEFYVAKRSTNGAFGLERPDGLSDDPGRPLTFGFDELDSLSPFIDDVYALCAAQGLPVDAIMKESGPGQFEINLKHRADAVAAALDALLLKRAVKAAAKAHDLDATFMAKPHHDWAGSGMHVHVSLLDGRGENLFAGDPLSPLCPPRARRHARDHGRFHGDLGANRQCLSALRAEGLCLHGRALGVQQPHRGLAHSAWQRRRHSHRASHRRGRRQPLSGDGGDSRRHAPRYCQRDRPGPAVEGDSEGIEAPPLPTAWVNALDEFKRSEIVRDAFGPGFQEMSSIV